MDGWIVVNPCCVTPPLMELVPPLTDAVPVDATDPVLPEGIGIVAPPPCAL